ncbi:MAG TPA: GDSL-type esterase/lipase family protein [Vicinamibacterales bacterium]|nr:GDSL-type esterase/lipase family protein [Vicinamibacterales bacterium]
MGRAVHVALSLVVLAAACTGTPTSPAPARWSSASPGLLCPAPLTVAGVIGAAAPVSFPLPQAAGDTAVAEVVCTPAPGATFTLGTTPVMCQAVDRIGRDVSCGFTVTLTPAMFALKRIVAFGDSVTRGETGVPFGEAMLLIIDTPNAYPTRLQERFDTDFPGQGIIVINQGVSGERITEAVARLPGVVMAQQPGGLLLLVGYNDLFTLGMAGAAPVAEGLRTMIRAARLAGVPHVLVSTLTPSQPGPRQIEPAVILQANVLIRQVAAAEGALLVAADDAFFGQAPTLVGPDGLHLTPAGNQVLAAAFYAALRNAVPVTSSIR